MLTGGPRKRHVYRPANAAETAPAPVAQAPTPATAATTAQEPAADLLTPVTVAGRLGVTTKVLERWRGAGEGPAFVRLTRKTLRYQAVDVDAFIATRVRASTAAA